MHTLPVRLNTTSVASWQILLKRCLDIAFAMVALILLTPVLLFILIKTKLSSRGPVFFTQKRIGLHGRSFTIYKFRSMIVNAEEKGPALSFDGDKRITKWGKVMRKWRLDELPQLINILQGEMSLVGPRPERAFYIHQISAINPNYKLLFDVKPGLTSLGMVQYGYASSVEEMLERMKYDLAYIDRFSLLLDFKIMFYTLRLILSGKGK